jgi:hypothetical protein
MLSTQVIMDQKYTISMGPRGFTNGKTCSISVMRGHTKFSIKVESAQVEGTEFGKELSQQLEFGTDCAGSKCWNKPLFDHIYQHCLPLLERLAPEMVLKDLSLEGFLHSPSYNLEIVKGDDCSDSKGVRIKGGEECLYIPAFFTSPIRTVDLPKLDKTVPLFQACDIYIAPTLDEGEKEKTLESIQGRVVTAEGPLFFKPRAEPWEPEFERDLCTLSRIDAADLPARIKVPKLHSLVVSGENTIGMLMTMIPGVHLRSESLYDKHALHQKWEEQITAIVQELHAHDIVWGGVHPKNIVIDEAMDAWAVDFGGLNNPRFVDDEKRGTREGDWQGVTRVFQEWLPDPQRANKW